MIVEVEVISQKGECAAGLKKGDKFRFDPGMTPLNFCASAYAALYPNLKSISAGGTFPWAEKDGSILVACPDSKNPLVSSIKIVKDK